VDPGHWATEWPWLPAAARAIADELGDTVDVHVSHLVTDPWTAVVTRTPDPGTRPEHGEGSTP
jgi:hypothetical protein